MSRRMSEASLKRKMSEADKDNIVEEKVSPCSMHPESPLFKGIGLLFICSIGFGSYFCYDGPGAIQEEFQRAMEMEPSEFGLLYSLYSFPNMVMPIIGGFLIDRVFGIRLGAIIFATFIAAGQALTTLGCFLDSTTVLYIGRFVFGLGGENLAVACNTYASSWFTGKALNMAFGFQLAVVRVGSAVSLNILGPIYNSFLVDECTLVPTTTMDPDATTVPSTSMTTTSSLNTTSPPYDCEKEENLAIGWTMAVASSSVVLSLFGSMVAGILDKMRTKHVANEVEEQPKIQLSDLKTFPVSYWLVSVVCVAYYVAIFPFISFAQPFFEREDGFNFESDGVGLLGYGIFDPKCSSFIQSLPYYMSAVLAPLLGYVIDRSGRNVAWVMLSCVLTLIAHCLLVIQKGQGLAYTAMVILGFGYSMLASSLWPIIAMVVPLHRQGTAYGVTQAIQNAGLGLISFLVGVINEADDTFVHIEIFYIAWLVLAILTTALVWLLDFRKFKYLWMTDKQRKVFEQTPEYFESLAIEVPSHLQNTGKENKGFDQE